jgi:hypothetical protein
MKPPVVSRQEWMALTERAERRESLLEYARRKLVPSEHTEQTWLFQMFAAKEAAIPELALVFAVPNGGHRNEVVAKKLKAEGVKAGVPDLVWPVARGRHHGLFVEMKKLGGHASEGQRKWLTALLAQGYFAVTCQGADAAYQAFMRYWDFGPFTQGTA